MTDRAPWNRIKGTVHRRSRMISCPPPGLFPILHIFGPILFRLQLLPPPPRTHAKVHQVMCGHAGTHAFNVGFQASLTTGLMTVHLHAHGADRPSILRNQPHGWCQGVAGRSSHPPLVPKVCEWVLFSPLAARVIPVSCLFALDIHHTVWLSQLQGCQVIQALHDVI